MTDQEVAQRINAVCHTLDGTRDTLDGTNDRAALVQTRTDQLAAIDADLYAIYQLVFSVPRSTGPVDPLGPLVAVASFAETTAGPAPTGTGAIREADLVATEDRTGLVADQANKLAPIIGRIKDETQVLQSIRDTAVAIRAKLESD